MSEKKIVFIVGAGASKEIGLPTGNKLKETIAKMFLYIDYEFDNQKNGSKLNCSSTWITLFTTRK